MSGKVKLSIPTTVADRLRDDILTGRFSAGQRLTEAELTTRYAVSRGRVREAIQQLTRQGLITVKLNCGATVAPDAPKEVRDLLVPMRRQIELHALRSVFPRLNQAAFSQWEAILADMRSACEREDNHGIVEADVAFHRLILLLNDQPDLTVVWETIIGRVRSHFLWMQWRKNVLMDVHTEHRELLDAFRSGNVIAACELLGQRID